MLFDLNGSATTALYHPKPCRIGEVITMAADEVNEIVDSVIS